MYEATRTIMAKTWFKLVFAGDDDHEESDSSSVILTCRAYLGTPWVSPSRPVRGRTSYVF